MDKIITVILLGTIAILTIDLVAQLIALAQQ